MSLAVTAQQMIDAARRITKTETLDPANAFVTDTELLAVLTTEVAELDDAVKENQDEEFEAAISPPIVLVSGQTLYPMPVDCYRVTSVDVQWNAQVTRSARRFTEAERNRFRNIQPAWTQFGHVYYRTRGSNLEIMPTPTSAVTIYINYSPSFTPFVANTDVYDSQNGWHMAAVWGLAGYIATADNDLEKAALCYAQKERQLVRARSMASARITGEPPRIQSSRRRDGSEDF